MADSTNNENLKSASISEFMNLVMSMGNPSDKSSLMDSVLDGATKIKKAAKSSTAINDSYGNSLLAIGNNDKVDQFDNYRFTNDTLNWPLWLALYNDSWVFRRAIDKPSQDAIRCGIKILGSFDKKDEVERLYTSKQSDLIQLLQWGSLFGGSIAVCMFNKMEDADYEKSLLDNKGKIEASKVMRLYVTDRWYGVSPSTDDTVTDMESLDYGKPKFYEITFANGHRFKVHHDYIIRYEHRTAPKLVKQGMLQGWGYSEGSHILNELSRDDKLKDSIQSLINKALIEVVKMAGMRGLFMGTDQANQDQLMKRLEMVNWARGYNSLTFLDKDDDYSMTTFGGLNGLADLLEQNMWLISAALEMQGVLFGDLKQGFSNDTDALERYAQTILGRCEDYVRPVLTKFLWVVYRWKNISESIEFEFNSLMAKHHDEQKMTDTKQFQEMLSALINDGVITTQQYAKALVKFIDKGVVDLGLDEEAINKLEETMTSEMESITV